MSNDHDDTGSDARVGGKSALDDFFMPKVRQALIAGVDFFVDTKPMQAAIEHLTPMKRSMVSAAPMLLSLGIARMPLKWFPSRTVAHLLQHVIVEVAQHLEYRVNGKGGVHNVTPEEYGDAVKEKLTEINAATYVLDPAGVLHKGECRNLYIYTANQQQQRTDRDGKPIPPRTQLRNISLKDAVSQQVPVASCCFPGMQDDAAKEANPSKAAPKAPPRSPAEVLARVSNEHRKVFMDWYANQDDAARARIQELLKHLDSTEELDGLNYVIKNHGSVAMEMLAMMENSNGSLNAAKMLKQIGLALKEGWTAGLAHLVIGFKWAVREYSDFDKSLEPTVQKLKANNASARPRPTLEVLGMGRKKRRKGFWASLVDF